ncbi:MAG: SusC/RagA family TonB-linked outer membrane protein, partial [Flavobacterium sp.]
FITQEVSVGTNTQIKVSLKSLSNTMDEVTIIGYGTQAKKDNTGAVTSFDAEKQLKDIPNNSAEQSLVGRLAGVQIGASEGSLDADYRIVIRGGGSITQDNSPLYIIDGIQVEDGLKSLSPQDIERIDVLKDASSTAIYGSRGANGVVLITTKSGKAGTTTVSYNGIFGINKLNSTLPVMSPYEFVVYQWERTRIESAANQTSFSGIYKVNTFADIDRFNNVTPVNWQEEVMGNDAQMLTNNVSINGGKGDTRFNFSYTNNNQDGIVLNTDYKRNIFALKLDQKVSDKLKVSFTTRYTETRTNGAGLSDAGNAQVNGLRNFVKYKPYLNDNESAEEFDEEYFNLTNQGGGLGLQNPVAWSLAKYRKGATSIFNLGGNLNYKIIKGLSYTGTAGMNNTNIDTKGFNDVLRSIGNPSTTFITSKDRTLNWSNVLNYNNSENKTAFSKKNSITLLAGQEIYISQSDDLDNRFNLYPRGITADVALSQLTQGTVVPGYPNRSLVKSTLFSYFGRANYSFNSKYLASFTVRADGSSKFRPGNRWGYFPSAAVAWAFSNENFMKVVKFISNAKLRLSYGTSGNNRIPDYLY